MSVIAAQNPVALDPSPDDAAELVRFLAGRDVACPLCGYNLRGLTGGRCPECGRELRLSVGLTEPYLRAWVVLAASACAAGGTGLFFILLVLVDGWPRGWDPVRAFFMSATMIYFMTNVPVAAAVLGLRRRILRLPAARQWTLAWTSVATASAAMIVFITFVK